MAFDTFKVAKRAEENLSKIFDYYTNIDDKLAKQFFQEIDKCFEYIKDFPYMFTKKYKEIRVCFTKVFPYGIYYIVRVTPIRKKITITIINILHTSRKVRYKE
ncbi:type II toxin-antitoxin system RelE/ParE family toxin [Capnocytophaga sputigena]|jgi:hypothetical protein|uniref:type II toxin-antitoxin system RelE/ParE family toxin n=1 Tax=Capnocytophaga sputigena TaxID=1019 RepID=UPI0028D5BB6D|nr:type II toxin-antitoxin system RelE/ParE family toxin [Capnocytophaga sputigena]